MTKHVGKTWGMDKHLHGDRLPAEEQHAELTVSRVAQGMRVICCRATSSRVSTARMSTFRHAVVTAWNWSSSSLTSTCIAYG